MSESGEAPGSADARPPADEPAGAADATATNSEPQSPKTTDKADKPNAKADRELRSVDTPQDDGQNTQVLLIAVSFKEAALDSPTFRASMNHTDEQLEYFFTWLRGFNKTLVKLSSEMDVIQDLANAVIAKFVPDFVTQGIVDHDYTMLALRRYAEATRHFWAKVISQIKNANAHTVRTLENLDKTQLQTYRETRKRYERTQAAYDGLLYKYAAASKTRDPSGLREDAFQMSEERTAYIRASFDLCCVIVTVKKEINSALIAALADPWLVRSKSLNAADPVYHQIGAEMYRLRSFVRALRSSLDPIEKDMWRLRKELEDATIKRGLPSRDLEDYLPTKATVAPGEVQAAAAVRGARPEKYGWLWMKMPPRGASRAASWARRWAFVRNGMFGWLAVAPARTYVQESEKIGVLLCKASPDVGEDRRFCFQVTTNESTMVFQADSLGELRAWLVVFEVAKQDALRNGDDGNSAAFERTPPVMHELAAAAEGEAVAAAAPGSVLASVGVGGSGVGTGPPDGSSSGSGSHHQAGGDSAATQDATGAPTRREMNTIQTVMSAAKTLTLQSLADSCNGQFSSLGSRGAPALAPSPMINTPMPTAMTREAIVVNLLLKPSLVPSAVTANYWGSVNWSAYQRLEAEGTPQAATQAIKRQPLYNDIYPSYYPLELKSQDLQMRAMFQVMAYPYDPDDRVVMVFRCLFWPNPKQELSGRAFVTMKHLYMYSSSLGFTILFRRSLRSFVSVEGKSNTAFDTLRVVSADGDVGSLRLFLDNGRLVQRRLQYLINNVTSDRPASLAEVLDNLRAIQIRPPDGPDGEDSDDAEAEAEDDDKADFYDDKLGSPIKKILQKYLHSGREKKQSAGTAKAIGTKAEPIAKSNVSDLSLAMDHKLLERDFAIQPKGLFHVLFGESSSVFAHGGGLLYNRRSVDVQPWQVSGHGGLQREVRYKFDSLGVLRGGEASGKKDAIVSTIQRIERRDDNTLYIVSERRSPWELPYGATFYLMFRYVISEVTRRRSRLAIWMNIEWIKEAGIGKNVVEPAIMRHAVGEAVAVGNRTADSVKQLGRHPTPAAAIRTFGKLGTKFGAPPQRGSSSKDSPDSSDAEQAGASTGVGGAVMVPARLFWRMLTLNTVLYVWSWVLSIVQNFIGVFILVGRYVWRNLTLHKLLLLGLLVSLAFNAFLSARVTIAYWTERNAMSIVHKLRLIPDHHTVMRRSLYASEIDDLVAAGSPFSASPDQCYSRFKSLVHYAPFDDPDLDMADFELASTLVEHLDEDSLDMAARVHRTRNEIAFRRNELVVSLRVLNRMEQESLLAEWRNFLVREIAMCSRSLPLVGDNSTLRHRSLADYCNDCMLEWDHSVTASDFSLFA